MSSEHLLEVITYFKVNLKEVNSNPSQKKYLHFNTMKWGEIRYMLTIAGTSNGNVWVS